MRNSGNGQIVPALHSLPLIVLGAGMLSVVFAGFAGSKLPLEPTGAGIQQSEVLENLELVQDALMVSEITSLPTADLIVAAEDIVSAGQLFEPALMGGAHIDRPQTRMGVSVVGGDETLGPWSPPKPMSAKQVSTGGGGNSARRPRWAGQPFPRLGMPNARRGAGAPALTQPVTTNDYQTSSSPELIGGGPESVLNSETSGVSLAPQNDESESKQPDMFAQSTPEELTSEVISSVEQPPLEEGLAGGDNTDVRELFEIQNNQGPGAEQGEGPNDAIVLAQVSAPSSLLLLGIGLLATGRFRKAQAN